MTHSIAPHLVQRRSITVTVIGCGGNGSVIAMGLPYIHHALVASGHPCGLDVTLIDGDTISAANCARQPFSRSEVGLKKSIVLASRINLFWGLQWKAIQENVGRSHQVQDADIVISCVDTRAARQSIRNLVTGNATVCYWLDLGNGTTGGQFVLGQPWNARNSRRAERLRTVAELFPDVADASLGEDEAPSCSVLEALERQEPFVNQGIAVHALAMLARLFRHGQLDVHGAFLNLARHLVHPIYVDQQVWRHLKKRKQSSAIA